MPVDVQKQGDHLLNRLDQEMARTAVQYDGHRDALARHHHDMDDLADRLEGKATTLRGPLEKMLSTPGKGLDARTAQTGLRYLRVMAKLGKARTARRMGYGATLPRGYGKPGSPLG